VQSQTQLFAVRYTEAWYNGRASEWEVLAYIDRAEAWAIYEPALRQKAQTFRNLYRAAEADGEPIKQFYLYQAARGSMPELERLLGFARVLHPRKAAAFSDVSEAAAALAQKTAAARTGTRIYIDCPADSEAAVYSALARAFGGLGFTAEQDKEAASAVCEAAVNENAQKLEAGTFYTPGITVTLRGKSGTFFTWSAAAQRAGAFNPDIARRRAYAALAQRIDETFAGEFTRVMSNF
jgi:hypothetical protein